MASCSTSQWVANAPIVKLTVEQQSETNTQATLSWKLQYIANYAANASSRDYVVKINGETVKDSSYNIDGVTGTKDIASGTYTVTKGTSAKTISFSVSFEFKLTWSGVYGGTKSASGSISVAKKPSYSIKYNANGGTGAPSTQTKWYGSSLTLSSVVPTRAGYTFLGWATSSTATSASYQPGASYTSNSGTTLYAVWQVAYNKPRITNYAGERCNSSGTLVDNGTYAKISFSWACDKTVSSISIVWKNEAGSTVGTQNVSASGTSGNVSTLIGSGALNTEAVYVIEVTVTDSGGSYKIARTLAGEKFPLDVLYGGKGLAAGKAATLEGYFDIGYLTRFRDTAILSNGIFLKSLNASGAERVLVGMNSSNEMVFGYGSYSNSDGTVNYDGNTVGLRSKGAINITSPTAGLTARAYGVNKVLWSHSNGYYMTDSQSCSLSEKISAQPHGIILAVSYYDSGGKNYDWNYAFVPKAHVANHSATGISFFITTGSLGAVANKYLYISDTSITGYANNDDSGTVCDINYYNAKFVLRYVIGV